MFADAVFGSFEMNEPMVEPSDFITMGYEKVAASLDYGIFYLEIRLVPNKFVYNKYKDPSKNQWVINYDK